MWGVPVPGAARQASDIQLFLVPTLSFSTFFIENPSGLSWSPVSIAEMTKNTENVTLPLENCYIFGNTQ
jgi:hypothetical protein